MKFPVYSQSPANTESVIPPLKEIFKGTDITVIEFNSSDLRNGILRERDTVGFSLPGIIGETSGYTDQLGEYGLQEMSAATREGRVMLAICAGLFFITRETIYAPKWGPYKSRTPRNHLLKAQGYGPVTDMGRQFESSWPSTLTLAQVWYKSVAKLNGKDDWRHAAVPYGNGPAIILDNPDDPTIERLAYYSEVPNNPLAALSVEHGDGRIIGLGALPHIGYIEIAPHPDFESLRNLLRDMKPHEPARQDFMDTVAQRLHSQILTYRQKFSI